MTRGVDENCFPSLKRLEMVSIEIVSVKEVIQELSDKESFIYFDMREIITLSCFKTRNVDNNAWNKVPDMDVPRIHHRTVVVNL